MMKKSLSLILVVALAFSITAFAESLTEIYLAQDFENYNSVNEFINTFDNTSINAGSHTEMPAGTILNTINTLNQGDPELAKSAVISAAAGANKAPITAANSEIQMNSFGKKSLRTTVSGMSSKQLGALLFIPERSWDFIDNPGQIYVISYDVESNFQSTSDKIYYLNSTYFTNEDKSNIFDLNLIYMDGRSYGAVFSTGHGSGVQGNTLVNGVAQRVAFGYTYGEGKEYSDASGTPYIVPKRLFYKNGGKWGSKTESTDNFGTAHGWKDKSSISAFRLGFSSSFGLEFADILAYTINNQPSEFKVEPVENIIDIDEKVVLKFNTPIYCGSFVKEALSITENTTNPFTMYEIGKIKNVVENGEVYSTVELEFPYGLKAQSTYDVTFNTSGTTVINEIGWKLPDGNNKVSFSTNPVSITDNIEIVGKSGLAGTQSDLTLITKAEQAKFTAKAVSMDKPSFLFIGIFDGPEPTDNLISYTYIKATEGDILSLASEVQPGYTVKAFSCGSLYDLSQLFSTEATIPTTN